MPQFTPYANESQAAFNRRMASAQRNPGQEWLDKLRDGGRVVGSPQLLEATGRFTERLGAPRPPRSGMAPSQSDPPGSRPSLMSAISSLRPDPSDTGTDPRNPRSFSPNPLVRGGYEAVPSPAELDAAQVESQVGSEGSERARSDVSDKTSGIGAYFGAPGMGTAMIGAGGAMMEAAGQSGANFGGSLGTGLKEFASQRAKFGESEMARRQLAQEGQAPLQELTARQNALRARAAMRGITDPVMLERLMVLANDPKSFEAALEELDPPEAVAPTDLEELQDEFAWFDGLTEEKQAVLNSMRNPAVTGTTVNTGDTPRAPAEEAMGEWVKNLYGTRQTIENLTMPGIANIEQTLDMVNDPRFGEVSGVLRGNAAADVVARVQGDPHLLGMIGTFERLSHTRTLQILANFTGAKSNYELDMARKMAQGDRSMSPGEMRSALNLMKRAYIQDAVRWARDIQGLAPIEGAFSDVDAGFRGRAQSILDQYGEEERSYHQSVDPFNIGKGR